MNIYELLKNDFEVTDSVLDVGCGELCDLVNFESTEFKKLIGIDKGFKTNAFGAYYRIHSVNLTLEPAEERSFRQNLLQKFLSTFTIYNGDFNNYSFQQGAYSLLICNKVLHFYCDSDKLTLIQKFYDSLQLSGLMFIKINHYKHPNNTDLKEVNHITGHIYQNKNESADIRYLIKPLEFLNTLRGYNILEKYTVIDERTLTFVIRKVS